MDAGAATRSRSEAAPTDPPVMNTVPSSNSTAAESPPRWYRISGALNRNATGSNGSAQDASPSGSTPRTNSTRPSASVVTAMSARAVSIGWVSTVEPIRRGTTNDGDGATTAGAGPSRSPPTTASRPTVSAAPAATAAPYRSIRPPSVPTPHR